MCLICMTYWMIILIIIIISLGEILLSYIANTSRTHSGAGTIFQQGGQAWCVTQPFPAGGLGLGAVRGKRILATIFENLLKIRSLVRRLHP